MLVIKERAIYELTMADKVDPGRTNISLPNMIQKLVINKGSESEIVGKTFLTAKALFRSGFYDPSIDITLLLSLSLDLLMELAVLEREINQYLVKEKKESEEYDQRKKDHLPYKLPSVLELDSHCKTIFQKADHIEQILMEIILVFYPNEGLTKQSHFPLFHQLLITKYGDEDHLTKLIGEILYFMKVVRAIRNALDHRLDTVKVKNFELQPDSSIISPTIELNHKEEKMDRISLSTFLPIVMENFLKIAEETIAHLAVKNVRRNLLITKLAEIPENERINKFVKYGFWAELGEMGFFYQ